MHFVQAIAHEVGLHADEDPKLMTKPHAYLDRVRLDNPVLGDGSAAVTTQQIAAANGAPAVATRANVTVAPLVRSGAAATSPSAQTTPSLSAAAIAAGYRASAGGNH